MSANLEDDQSKRLKNAPCPQTPECYGRNMLRIETLERNSHSHGERIDAIEKTLLSFNSKIHDIKNLKETVDAFNENITKSKGVFLGIKIGAITTIVTSIAVVIMAYFLIDKNVSFWEVLKTILL